MPRRRLVFLVFSWRPATLLAVFLLCLHCAAPLRAAPAENGADSSAGESLARIWAARTGDLAGLAEETASLQSRAEDLAPSLTARIQAVQVQFARLAGIFKVSRGHPTEQLTLAMQMRGLHRELQQDLSPLKDISDTLTLRLEEIADIRAELNSLVRENEAEGVSLQEEGDAEAKGLQTYSRSLADVERRLKTASLRLARLLAPAESALERIGRSVAEQEASLGNIWESYYLTPSDNSLTALAATPALLAEWAGSLKARHGFAYPQSAGAWLDALRVFLTAALGMAGLGWLGLRGAALLPSNWRGACEAVIRRAWVWTGLGLAVLMAAGNSSGGAYLGFVLLGSLILIAGVASLSWRLRVAVVPSLERKPSPLFRLYAPAAFGMLMLFADLPMRILGIVWAATMILFLAWIIRLNRAAGKARASFPLLERFSYGCAFYLGLGSLLTAVAGHARVAILVFMFLFALVNTLTLGNALTGLLDALTGRLLPADKMPVRLAIAEAVSRPAAWLLALLCTLPWLWAAPGAFALLNRALSASYTVGEASFDFSKVLLVAVCFFLFRAFIRLGQTSLDHLPRKMPYIERGVIPPLRTLLSYGIWTLFAFLCLGLFGVDFTSLAVVAGGLSVGIGFGMQNLFNNMISGAMLLFGRTILVGDFVEVAGASGTVRAINIRSTTIETPDRALVYVPNSAIVAGQFVNWTRNSRMVRRTLSVGVAYGSPTALVAELLEQAAAGHPHVLATPAPTVYFQNFGDSALEFQIFFFVDDFDNAIKTLSDVRLAVDRLFSQHGIDIPFPQLTVHGASEAETLPRPPTSSPGPDACKNGEETLSPNNNEKNAGSPLTGK